MKARQPRRKRSSAPKGCVLFIRVSPEQKRGLDAAAERHDLPTATWAREVLLVAAGCGDLGKTASLVAATKLDGGKP